MFVLASGLVYVAGDKKLWLGPGDCFEQAAATSKVAVVVALVENPVGWAMGHHDVTGVANEFVVIGSDVIGDHKCPLVEGHGVRGPEDLVALDVDYIVLQVVGAGGGVLVAALLDSVVLHPLLGWCSVLELGVKAQVVVASYEHFVGGGQTGEPLEELADF